MLGPGGHRPTSVDFEVFQVDESCLVLGQHFVDRVEEHQSRLLVNQVFEIPRLESSCSARVVLQVFELQFSPHEEGFFGIHHHDFVALRGVDSLVDWLVFAAHGEGDLGAYSSKGNALGVEHVVNGSVSLKRVLRQSDFLVGERKHVVHHVLVVGQHVRLHEPALVIHIVDAHVLTDVDIIVLTLDIVHQISISSFVFFLFQLYSIYFISSSKCRSYSEFLRSNGDCFFLKACWLY